MLFLFAVLFASGTSYAGNDRVLQLGNKDSYSLDGYLEYLSDDDGRLTFKEILEKDKTTVFISLPSSLNRSYTRKTSWIHFKLKVAGDDYKKFYLAVMRSHINELTMYIQKGANASDVGSYNIIELGDHTPLLPDSIASPLVVASGEVQYADTINVYVRLHTNSVHSFGCTVMNTNSMIHKTGVHVLFYACFIVNADEKVRQTPVRNYATIPSFF